MRAYEFIRKDVMEGPLPDGRDGNPAWDKQIFTPKTSYKKRSEYASERAPKIGKGSSRTAFDIPYFDDEAAKQTKMKSKDTKTVPDKTVIPQSGILPDDNAVKKNKIKSNDRKNVPDKIVSQQSGILPDDESKSEDREIIPQRSSVLKIAHNKKGAAQNQAEAAILDDGYLKSLDIAIPLIDYDKDHDEPTWLQTERAKKATPKTLCNLLKTPSLDHLVNFASYSIIGDDTSDIIADVSDKFPDNDDIETFINYANKLMDLAISFDINISDFRRAANWGIYNGKPVVIDLGYTEEVKNKHY